MPLYEYDCKCGKKFEAIMSIADRHNAICECGRIARLKMSAWGRVIFAGFDTVVGHDGTILSRKQSTEQMSSLAELFEGYVDENDPLGFVGEELNLGWRFGSDIIVSTGHAESFDKKKQLYKIKCGWNVTLHLSLKQLERASIIKQPLQESNGLLNER